MSDTKHQIATLANFPAELWGDVPARDTAWGVLREKAEKIAADAGMALTADPDFGRSVHYMHFVDGSEGSLILVETTRQQAEIVMLRCCFWARP
jgi:hypothetical protein